MTVTGKSTDAATGRQGGALLLWLGLLIPPAAWMIQLFALYMLEDFISCTPGSRTPGLIAGVGVRPIALVLTGILGLLTIGAGISSLFLWKSSKGDDPTGGPLTARRWMALAGIMNSALFAIIILIKAAPPLILGVCESAL